jgi:hypothetical protein
MGNGLHRSTENVQFVVISGSSISYCARWVPAKALRFQCIPSSMTCEQSKPTAYTLDISDVARTMLRHDGAGISRVGRATIELAIGWRSFPVKC